MKKTPRTATRPRSRPVRGDLPAKFIAFRDRFPAVLESYERLGEAGRGAGPLDARTCALVKLGIAVGGRMEGAVHSHVRRALEAGCSPAEIRHATVLALTTIGFPSMMAALSWVDDVIDRVK